MGHMAHLSDTPSRREVGARCSGLIASKVSACRCTGAPHPGRDDVHVVTGVSTRLRDHIHGLIGGDAARDS
jgi:hypothetical protein